MFEGDRSHTDERLPSGGRWFLGGSSLVHASTDFENNYEAGITQYNLLRRGAWAALNVRWTSNDGTFETPGRPGIPGGPQRITFDFDPSLELRFGVPVSGNHSIVGQMDRHSQSHRITLLDAPGDPDETGGTRVREGELAWLYDTTDDPLFPTSGTIWRTGATIGTFTTTSSQFGDATLRSLGSRSSVTRYHPVNDYLSLSYGLTAGTTRHSSRSGEIDFTTDSWGYGPSAGFSVSLWPHSLTRRLGDLRWQTIATYSINEGDVIAPNTLSVESSIGQRNVWGILRLSFIYVDTEWN